MSRRSTRNYKRQGCRDSPMDSMESSTHELISSEGEFDLFEEDLMTPSPKKKSFSRLTAALKKPQSFAEEDELFQTDSSPGYMQELLHKSEGNTPSNDDIRFFSEVRVVAALRSTETAKPYLEDALHLLTRFPQESGVAVTLATTMVKMLLRRWNMIVKDRSVAFVAVAVAIVCYVICAPQPPVEDEDTVKVFQMLSNLLQWYNTFRSSNTKNMLSCKSMKKYLIVILKCLDVSRCSVLPVILRQRCVDGADDLPASLLLSAMQSVDSHQSDEWLQHVVAMCVEMIEEAAVGGDVYSIHSGQEFNWVHYLLYSILPSQRMKNEQAYKMAISIIRQAPLTLQSPIIDAINSLIKFKHEEQNSTLPIISHQYMFTTAIANDIYGMIYELHKVGPQLIGGLLPALCRQCMPATGLDSSPTFSDENRANIVTLVGRLFSTSYGDFARQYSTDCREFRRRLSDPSPDVRAATSIAVCNMLRNQRLDDADARDCEEKVVRRLRDGDELVRITATSSLTHVALHQLDLLKPSTIIEIIERVKDTSPRVRIIAISSVSRLYGTYISSKLPPLEISHRKTSSVSSDELLRELIPKETRVRLGSIPGTVIKCWPFPDVATKHAVITALQDFLLPSLKTSSDNSTSVSVANMDSLRATALVSLFINGDQTDRSALTEILAYKSRVAASLRKLLSEVADNKSGNIYNECICHLQELVPMHDRHQRLGKQMTELYSDSETYDAFKTCLDNSSPYHVTSEALKTIVRHAATLDGTDMPHYPLPPIPNYCTLVNNVGLAAYMMAVVDISCASGIASTEMINTIVKWLGKNTPRDTLPSYIDLLATLARYSPSVFSSTGRQFVQFISVVIDRCDAVLVNQVGTPSSSIVYVSQPIQMWSSVSEILALVLTSWTALDDVHHTNDQHQSVIFSIAEKIVWRIHEVKEPSVSAHLGRLFCQLAYRYTLCTGNVSPSASRVQQLLKAYVEEVLTTGINDLRAIYGLSGILEELSDILSKPLYAKHGIIEVFTYAWPYIKHILKIAGNIANKLHFEGNKPKTKFSSIIEINSRLAVLRLLTYLICATYDCLAILPSDAISDRNEVEKQLENTLIDITNATYKILESDGAEIGNANVPPDMQTTAIRCAMVAVLSSARHPATGDLCEIRRWLSLSFMIASQNNLDRDPTVFEYQREMLQSLLIPLAAHQLHPKFLVLTCLFLPEKLQTTPATKQNELHSIASKGIIFAVRRMRAMHSRYTEMYRTRLHEVSAAPSDEEETNTSKSSRKSRHKKKSKEHSHSKPDDEANTLDMQLRRALAVSEAESLLPYLLYLLSYHPDFPSTINPQSSQERRQTTYMMQLLSMLLDTLRDTLPAKEVPYMAGRLWRLCDELEEKWVDAQDSGNAGIFYLVELTRQLLCATWVDSSDSLDDLAEYDRSQRDGIYISNELYTSTTKQSLAAEKIISIFNSESTKRMIPSTVRKKRPPSTSRKSSYKLNAPPRKRSSKVQEIVCKSVSESESDDEWTESDSDEHKMFLDSPVSRRILPKRQAKTGISMVETP